jgi:hypothetical protein
MRTDPIALRGRGAEAVYFERLERQARRRRAEAERAEGAARELSAALGVGAEEAAALLRLGIDAERAPAFEALPLVEVAWADGAVDEAERWRVLEAASRLGMELGRPAHALLEEWLLRRPEPALLEAWRRFAAAGRPRTDVIEAAEHIANAAGGVLGFGLVSRAERRALEEIRHSLALGAGSEGRS